MKGKKIVSRFFAVWCLNFFLNVTKIYQLKNWKCCLLLEKMSKNCQSVQLQGVKQIVSKVWVVGCLNFCLKVTKVYKLEKKILLGVEENVQKLSEYTVWRAKKIVSIVSTEKKSKYCLMLKKMSKKCHSVWCKGVEKLSQKYALWGV